MTTVSLLFTSVGRRVELLAAFRRSHAELGLTGRMIATDVDPLSPALALADRRVIVPRVTDAAYIPTLVDLCGQEKVDVVFPLIDPDVPVLAAARPEFEAQGTAVAVMNIGGALIAGDKLQTSVRLTELGIPTARTWDPASLPSADQLSFPLFIKPRWGSAAIHTYRIDDHQQLAFFLGYVPHPVVQEFLTGPEITVDAAFAFDGRLLGMCQRERISVRGGEVQKGVTVWHEEIAAHCEVIGSALEARGPITIQCMMGTGSPIFTEINGRFGGGLPLAIAAGMDFPSWYLTLAAGRTPNVPPPGAYRTGLYMTRFDESHFLDEDYRRV